MAKIENDENLTQFSRRNLKKLGQSFQDEKTLMSMRESRDTPPLTKTKNNLRPYFLPRDWSFCHNLLEVFHYKFSLTKRECERREEERGWTVNS